MPLCFEASLTVELAPHIIGEPTTYDPETSDSAESGRTGSGADREERAPSLVKRLERADLLVAIAFAVAAVFLLNDTLFGSKVLLPIDNLYRIAPYSSMAAEAGVGVPHNDLIGDQILQNYSWRSFAAQSISPAVASWSAMRERPSKP